MADSTISGLTELVTPASNDLFAIVDTDVSQTKKIQYSNLGFVGSIGSSTDNAIMRWDGAGGATPQDSGVTIDDSGTVITAAVNAKSGGNLQLFDSAGGGITVNFHGCFFANENWPRSVREKLDKELYELKRTGQSRLF